MTTEPASEDRRAFHRSLPAKRMGAGAVIQDASGRVLLVNPTYKHEWEIPGGAVEADESPAAACRQELTEELGLTVEIGELLCVDYNPSTPDYVESLMFLFRVAPLSDQQIAAIRLPEEELSDHGFFDFDQARQLLSDRLWQRLNTVLDDKSDTTYLEEQQPVAATAATP